MPVTTNGMGNPYNIGLRIMTSTPFIHNSYLEFPEFLASDIHKTFTANGL
jgi:hypothetical protein